MSATSIIQTMKSISRQMPTMSYCSLAIPFFSTDRKNDMVLRYWQYSFIDCFSFRFRYPHSLILAM